MVLPLCSHEGFGIFKNRYLIFKFLHEKCHLQIISIMLFIILSTNFILLIVITTTTTIVTITITVIVNATANINNPHHYYCHHCHYHYRHHHSCYYQCCHHYYCRHHYSLQLRRPLLLSPPLFTGIATTTATSATIKIMITYHKLSPSYCHAFITVVILTTIMS